MENIFCSVELISPEQAEFWLENNNIPTNRNITKSRIRRYASDMVAGKWGLGQPLMFTESGALIDGQHRLSAVVQSDTQVKFVVLRGYPEESLNHIDTGKTRSTANIAEVTGRDGIKGHHISCFNGMFYAPGLNSRTSRELSDQQKLEQIEKIFEAIDFVCKNHNGEGRLQEGRIKNSTVNAVVARAYYYENHDRLESFLDGFRTGFTESGEDHAVIALRNLYMGLKSSTSATIKGSTSINQDLYNYTQLALTHFLKQNPVRALRLPKSPKNVWHVEVIDGPKNK